MAYEIKKVAVVGSGVMGSGIAAHMANAGVEVVLFDIVPKDADDRTMLAKGAIEKLKKSNPAAFAHKKLAAKVTPANLEDDLALFKDVDWVVEAIIENTEIKRSLYQKILPHIGPQTVVSSNTSTIPLEDLIENMPHNFAHHFMITHFFNPPRYMRLLELVTGKETLPEAVAAISAFCDERLGKGVVVCNDSPGFIANRIGCYWVMTAILEAAKMGLTVEEADAVMGRPVGIPKTGVFGLMDLIGIDLMPLIAAELKSNLPESDAFVKTYRVPSWLQKMLDEGYIGRKGKGGFYRLEEFEGKKIKQVRSLKDGTYYDAKRPKLKTVKEAKKGLWHLVESDDIYGKYAKEVLVRTLSYAASLIPEVADDITAVDEAMRLGYNWKYGPFELIDRLRLGDVSGASWLQAMLKERNEPVPTILAALEGRSFYDHDETKRQYFSPKKGYQTLKLDSQAWSLAEMTYGKKPILKNPSAKLWDVGDGIACFEFTSKMNSIDPLTLEMLVKSTEEVQKNFKGMIIGNDGDNFSVGANIGVLLFASNVAAWKEIAGILKQGQDTVMGLKYAPFPVVSAVSGMALGGGCEIILHSDAIAAHVETYTGLVEVGVGVVPGWGGCKEMIVRNLVAAEQKRLSLAQKGGMFALSVKQALQGQGAANALHPLKTTNAMPAVSKAFENIAMAKVSKSALEAKDMGILRPDDRITMNRKRVLADAKARCLEMAQNYQAPAKPEFHLPGKTAETALNMAVDGFVKSGKATEHDATISRALAQVLSGGDVDILDVLQEQNLLDLEVEAFIRLVKTTPTLNRLEHMLETGKPLRN